MGQNRRDQTWPQPRHTRHVWVLPPKPYELPIQGFVIAWVRQSYRWSALVVMVEPGERGDEVVQRWLPRERLMPARTDPNELRRFGMFFEAAYQRSIRADRGPRE